MKTEELIERLPEIEEWNTNWNGKMTTEDDVLALCAAVRELSAEVEALNPFAGHTLSPLEEKNEWAARILEGAHEELNRLRKRVDFLERELPAEEKSQILLLKPTVEELMPEREEK